MNVNLTKKILLVEDCMITALAEENMLIKNGYEVITIPDGESAVEVALNDSTIDLILMDIDLGAGIDGPSAADLIVRSRDIPIVFLTSHSERDIVNKVRSITRYGYVVKNSGDFVILSSLEMAFELFEAHRKTKDSENNFRHLAENVKAAFWLSDASMKRIIYLSPICWDMWEVEPEYRTEASWNFMKRIHPDDYKDVKMAKKNLMDRGEPYSGEFRIICGKGRVKWIRGKAYPVYSHEGEVIRFVAVAEDITSGKLAGDALMKSEADLRSYIENAPMGIFISDRNGRYIDFNPSAVKGLGYSRNELLDLGMQEIIDQSNIEIAMKHIHMLGENGTAASDVLFRKKGGSLLWAQVNSVKLNEERYISFCQDITSRKKAEILLFKSEERMRSIFDNLPIGIFQSTIGGKFIYVNSAISKILGYDSIEELNSKVNRSSIAEAIYEEPQKRNDIVQEVSSLKGGWKAFDIRYKRKDGTCVDVVIAFCERSDPINGEITLYGYVVDITEKKSAEGEIKRLLAEKDLLLKEVHHRIKNNMSTISGLLYLQSGSMNDPSAVSALDDARRRITSMMLIYDRLYRSGDYMYIDFSGYMSSLIDEISSTFLMEGVNIAIEKQIDRFSIDSRITFPIGIIINEIITNSFRHAFPGRCGGKIFISIRNCDNTLKLVIKDDGVGIPDVLNVKTTEGFGLSLIKMLIQQLNGRLEIIRNNGTEFLIDIEI